MKIGKKHVFWIMLLFFLIALLSLYFIRLFSHRELDDVSPAIPCEEELLLKTDVLFVIPIFENVSISENKEWCNYIISLNKTLAMHGVYHTFKEFSQYRNEEYIKLGMEEFKNCFGYYPKIFKAPQLSLSEENKKLLKKMDFQIKGNLNNIFHKVYHARDDGRFSYRFLGIKITNRLIDLI